MKYDEALKNIPAPGTGCHTALLSVANIGILSGIAPSRITEDIIANIPAGTRKVSRKEVEEAVRKAAATVTRPLPADENKVYTWSDAIPDFAPAEHPIVMDNDIEELPKPQDEWDFLSDFRRYMTAVFEEGEKPSICTDAISDDKGHYRPASKGIAFQTRGQLLKKLDEYLKRNPPKCALDMAITSWGPGGAWVRINPMDGKGANDVNVTSYRHALVECDTLPLERQLAIIRKLQLPCAAIVHSGGKSIHAVVKVDAENIKDYQDRYDYLLKICDSNGFPVDKANRNPSRYTRLPGVTRGEKRQYLIDTDCGQASWEAWVDYIEESKDELTPIEEASALLTHLPELAPCVIEDVLRRRHKMIVTGPSKAGKSFLLMELALSIATGHDWIGWHCAKGRALYVNLELDRASCLHRLSDICTCLGYSPAPGMLDVWNLRGYSVPLDQLAPRLIRRAKKKDYAAIILDPLYKIITGDENAAADMAKFCVNFDKIANATGAAVVICHHHSKGEQGQKVAMDRASGSGVFARDPDALIDLINLPIEESRQKTIADRWVCDALTPVLDKASPDWRRLISQDDALVAAKLLEFARGPLGGLADRIDIETRKAAEVATSWRIQGILREFPNFQPRFITFRWPVHLLDTSGMLSDIAAAGEKPTPDQLQKQKVNRQTILCNETKMAFEAEEKVSGDAPVTIDAMCKRLGLARPSIYKRLSKFGPIMGLEKGNGSIIQRIKKETT